MTGYEIGALLVGRQRPGRFSSPAVLPVCVGMHRLNAWQESPSWPAAIDVFLVIAKLALYAAWMAVSSA